MWQNCSIVIVLQLCSQLKNGERKTERKGRWFVRVFLIIIIRERKGNPPPPPTLYCRTGGKSGWTTSSRLFLEHHNQVWENWAVSAQHLQLHLMKYWLCSSKSFNFPLSAFRKENTVLVLSLQYTDQYIDFSWTNREVCFYYCIS